MVEGGEGQILKQRTRTLKQEEHETSPRNISPSKFRLSKQTSEEEEEAGVLPIPQMF